MKLLYRGFLYEAWDLNQIKQKFSKEVEEYLKKYNDNTPVDEYFAIILNTDPSADKKYLGAITKWVLEKRPEDLTTQIKEYLNRFKKILDIYPGGDVGNLSKMLAKGKIGFDEFKNKVIELEKKFAANLANPDIKANEANSNYRIINQNEKYVCFEIDRWIGTNGDSDDEDNKHICFSGDVDWCVKYKSYFERYNPPYYYFMEKATGKEYALMHIGSSQLKDIRDTPLSVNEVEPVQDLIYPILKKYVEDGKVLSFEGDFEILMSLYGDDIEKFKELKIYITSWFSYVELGMLAKMIELINMYKFDIDIRDSINNTALIYNSNYNDNRGDDVTRVEIADFLLKNGADVNAANNSKFTALFIAVKEYNLELCKFLIENKANVNAKNNKNEYMIEYVASARADITELLLAAGADPNIGYVEGDQVNAAFPLNVAIRNGNTDNIELLLKYGANPNFRLAFNDKTMYDIASKYGENSPEAQLIKPYMGSNNILNESNISHKKRNSIKIVYMNHIYES